MFDVIEQQQHVRAVLADALIELSNLSLEDLGEAFVLVMNEPDQQRNRSKSLAIRNMSMRQWEMVGFVLSFLMTEKQHSLVH